MNILGSKRSMIGVDISGRTLRAIQLRSRGKGHAVHAATSLDRADVAGPITTAELERLAGVLERQGFSGRDVVVAVPPDSLMATVLDLPPAGVGAPREQIARVELASNHKCNPGQVEVAFWELPARSSNREGVGAMAVGCAHGEANALLDEFEAAGLQVQALDVQACALARAVAGHTGALGLNAVLSIDWTAALVVMLLDGQIVFERALPDFGLDRLHQTLRDEIDLDSDVADLLLFGAPDDDDTDDEDETSSTKLDLRAAVDERVASFVAALGTELRLSFGYTAKEYGRDHVDELTLTGEAAAIRGMNELIARNCEMAVRTLCPTDLAECSTALHAICASPALLTAYGLALHDEG